MILIWFMMFVSIVSGKTTVQNVHRTTLADGEQRWTNTTAQISFDRCSQAGGEIATVPLNTDYGQVIATVQCLPRRLRYRIHRQSVLPEVQRTITNVNCVRAKILHHDNETHAFLQHAKFLQADEEDLSVDFVDRYFEETGTTSSVQLPTGVGLLRHQRHRHAQSQARPRSQSPLPPTTAPDRPPSNHRWSNLQGHLTNSFKHVITKDYTFAPDQFSDCNRMVKIYAEMIEDVPPEPARGIYPLFDPRCTEGFGGPTCSPNGYDWLSLALTFIGHKAGNIRLNNRVSQSSDRVNGVTSPWLGNDIRPCTGTKTSNCGLGTRKDGSHYLNPPRPVPKAVVADVLMVTESVLIEEASGDRHDFRQGAYGGGELIQASTSAPAVATIGGVCLWPTFPNTTQEEAPNPASIKPPDVADNRCLPLCRRLSTGELVQCLGANLLEDTLEMNDQAFFNYVNPILKEQDLILARVLEYDANGHLLDGTTDAPPGPNHFFEADPNYHPVNPNIQQGGCPCSSIASTSHRFCPLNPWTSSPTWYKDVDSPMIRQPFTQGMVQKCRRFKHVFACVPFITPAQELDTGETIGETKCLDGSVAQYNKDYSKHGGDNNPFAHLGSSVEMTIDILSSGCSNEFQIAYTDPTSRMKTAAENALNQEARATSLELMLKAMSNTGQLDDENELLTELDRRIFDASENANSRDIQDQTFLSMLRSSLNVSQSIQQQGRQLQLTMTQFQKEARKESFQFQGLLNATQANIDRLDQALDEQADSIRRFINQSSLTAQVTDAKIAQLRDGSQRLQLMLQETAQSFAETLRNRNRVRQERQVTHEALRQTLVQDGWVPLVTDFDDTDNVWGQPPITVPHDLREIDGGTTFVWFVEDQPRSVLNQTEPLRHDQSGQVAQAAIHQYGFQLVCDSEFLLSLDPAWKSTEWVRQYLGPNHCTIGDPSSSTLDRCQCRIKMTHRWCPSLTDSATLVQTLQASSRYLDDHPSKSIDSLDQARVDELAAWSRPLDPTDPGHQAWCSFIPNPPSSPWSSINRMAATDVRLDTLDHVDRIVGGLCRGHRQVSSLLDRVWTHQESVTDDNNWHPSEFVQYLFGSPDDLDGLDIPDDTSAFHDQWGRTAVDRWLTVSHSQFLGLLTEGQTADPASSVDPLTDKQRCSLVSVLNADTDAPVEDTFLLHFLQLQELSIATLVQSRVVREIDFMSTGRDPRFGLFRREYAFGDPGATTTSQEQRTMDGQTIFSRTDLETFRELGLTLTGEPTSDGGLLISQRPNAALEWIIQNKMWSQPSDCVETSFIATSPTVMPLLSLTLDPEWSSPQIRVSFRLDDSALEGLSEQEQTAALRALNLDDLSTVLPADQVTVSRHDHSLKTQMNWVGFLDCLVDSDNVGGCSTPAARPWYEDYDGADETTFPIPLNASQTIGRHRLVNDDLQAKSLYLYDQPDDAIGRCFRPSQCLGTFNYLSLPFQSIDHSQCHGSTCKPSMFTAEQFFEHIGVLSSSGEAPSSTRIDFDPLDGVRNPEAARVSVSRQTSFYWQHKDQAGLRLPDYWFDEDQNTTALGQRTDYTRQPAHAFRCNLDRSRQHRWCSVLDKYRIVDDPFVHQGRTRPSDWEYLVLESIDDQEIVTATVDLPTSSLVWAAQASSLCSLDVRLTDVGTPVMALTLTLPMSQTLDQRYRVRLLVDDRDQHQYCLQRGWVSLRSSPTSVAHLTPSTTSTVGNGREEGTVFDWITPVEAISIPSGLDSTNDQWVEFLLDEVWLADVAVAGPWSGTVVFDHCRPTSIMIGLDQGNPFPVGVQPDTEPSACWSWDNLSTLDDVTTASADVSLAFSRTATYRFDLMTMMLGVVAEDLSSLTDALHTTMSANAGTWLPEVVTPDGRVPFVDFSPTHNNTSQHGTTSDNLPPLPPNGEETESVVPPSPKLGEDMSTYLVNLINQVLSDRQGQRDTMATSRQRLLSSIQRQESLIDDFDAISQQLLALEDAIFRDASKTQDLLNDFETTQYDFSIQEPGLNFLIDQGKGEITAEAWECFWLMGLEEEESPTAIEAKGRILQRAKELRDYHDEDCSITANPFSLYNFLCSDNNMILFRTLLWIFTTIAIHVSCVQLVRRLKTKLSSGSDPEKQPLQPSSSTLTQGRRRKRKQNINRRRYRPHQSSSSFEMTSLI